MKLTLALFTLLIFSAPAQENDVPPPFEKKPAPVEADVEADDTDDAGAPDPFDPDAIDDSTPAIVQVQVEFIEMSHDKLTDLLFLKRPAKADATELRKELQTVIKGGDAKILETQVVVCRSGEKSLIESVHEQIFPTEYLPPTFPEHAGTPDKEAKPIAERTKPIAAPTGALVPTSFETRNIGSTLEIEPTVGSTARIIDLRFAPELTWYDGNTTWYEQKDALGNVSKVEMPDFYTIRLTTALTVTNGSYVLAGVASPKAKDGSTDLTRKVLVFVKANVLPVR